MKATEQFFSVVLFIVLYKVVLTLEYVLPFILKLYLNCIGKMNESGAVNTFFYFKNNHASFHSF